ncbi:hypothetical protein NKH75_29670 [Mesorhizobium sp. M0984]|uniref:hypothetical protein n=1 Tax=Mesorhizobium sp. M0984 TaxID=2957041 RepID=UPI00333527CF
MTSALGFAFGIAFAFVGLASAQQCISPTAGLPLGPADKRAVVFSLKENAAVFNDGDFSLTRTLNNILTTAGGSNVTPEQRETLLDSLLSNLSATTMTNDDSGLTFTVTPRPGESVLTAKKLLDPNGPDQMVPVGLFNRLDLAPKDLSNCGEYRIVYAKKNDKQEFDNRFFLIFEAALPNPNAEASPAACQEIAKFWSDLRTADDTHTAKSLVDFYFTGGPVVPGGENFEPVVDFRHYGIPNGQVRANAFVKPAGSPWHLRQWRTVLQQDGVPTFENEPVSENPVPAYFGGVRPAVIPLDVFQFVSGEFRNEFTRGSVSQLVNVDRTAALPQGPGTTAQDLIGNLGVGIEDKYYAVESNAARTDDPAARALGTPLMADIDDALRAMKLDTACHLTSAQVLNRMGAMTCGGCHQFSNGMEIAAGVNWPNSLGFVQINEEGNLSELLNNSFLPFRFNLVQSFLTTTHITQFVSTPDPYAVGLRVKLNGALQEYELNRSPLSSAMAKLAVIEDVTVKLRGMDRAQPGAFVFYRKPD